MQKTVSCTEKCAQSLMKCKPYLLSVLTHWEPSPILPNQSDDNTEPTPVAPSNSTSLHSDEMPRLMTATAHTLIKWTLRTLSEMPFEGHRTFATLKWLEKVLMPHDTIAKYLLTDEAMRIDLIRLYHQTCEFSAQEGSAFKLDIFQLFTTIMVHLLEMEKNHHPNVIKACLHSVTDLDKRGKFHSYTCFFLLFYFTFVIVKRSIVIFLVSCRSKSEAFVLVHS